LTKDDCACAVLEEFGPYDSSVHLITRIVWQERTPFQDLLIVDSPSYGRALVLDRRWQSSEADEFVYHEALVHPACVVRGDPRRALVLGGGEGATIREVLRWVTIDTVTMVDIDAAVVAACRKYLPSFHCGAFDDPRVELVFDDAIGMMARTSRTWDVIVADLPEPVVDGPAATFYNRESFAVIASKLSPGGVLALQAGPTGPSTVDLLSYAQLIRTVQSVFPSVVAYSAPVPNYPAPWGFVLATRDMPIRVPGADEADEVLSKRTLGELRMLDGISLQGLIHQPLHVRRAIRGDAAMSSQ
jgi:spermidine synthase